jgi:LiaF transmembrane domain
MHLDRRLLGWGVFFILLGAVPLAVRANAVDPDLVSRWPTLWPLLLIGWGVGLLLRGTPGHWLGGALTAITLGLMGGGAIATGFGGMPSIRGCGAGGGTAFAAQQGTFATTGRMTIEFNCGTLAVTTADGSSWKVTGSDPDGAGPVVEKDPDGSITLKGQERVFAFHFGDARSTWNVTLPRTPSLATDVTLNAGDGTIDLSGASVEAFDVTVNAGQLRADLRNATSLPHDGLNATINAGKATLALPAFDGSVGLSLNAGSLAVCLPAGTAIQVHWNGTIASNDLAQSGLVQVDPSLWQSAGFNQGAPHVELDVSANAGSFSLQLGGSCGA